MKSADLVRMANQITDYFAIYPKSEATEGIVKHIHNSWEPRMRDALRKHIEEGGKGLRPLFMEAMIDYFQGPHGDRKLPVNPQKAAPKGALPSFADGGGDAG